MLYEVITSFDEDDFMEIISPSNYWHGRSDPSSWLCEAIVRLGKSKFHKVLPRNAVITLCADALNITHEKLESSLDWNAGYMAWHEGGSVEEFHVWMKS